MIVKSVVVPAIRAQARSKSITNYYKVRSYNCKSPTPDTNKS